ncbi:MAG TPA: trypsin-like serine protease, partial [Acidimicrobiales bacterium]|nr:trypsin-like serine protease [Acidimicrobiales bacterium]
MADRGYDPAVVLIDLAGQGWCTGALIESDVVLTARRCIDVLSGADRCPAVEPHLVGRRDLTTLRVLVGDDAAAAVERARGRDVVMPTSGAICGSDVALLMLDATIDDVAPLAPSADGAAVGDRVRSVGLHAARKVVRDHVRVSVESGTEIELDEAPCAGAPGAIAIGASGEVVGVLSRGGPSCAASRGWDVYVRPDAFAPLVEQAMTMGHAVHASHQAKEKKGPVDLGAGCATGRDCAAGECVSFAGAQYCSLPCSPDDRCPSRCRCMQSQLSTGVCVEE